MKKRFELIRSDHSIKIMLDSGDGDCESYQGTTLYLALFGWLLRIRLPSIIKPRASWLDTSPYSLLKNGVGYRNLQQREFGFYLLENHFVVKWGAQSNCWPGPNHWSCFLPWNEWRQVRFSLYDANSIHFWSQIDRKEIRGITKFTDQFEAEEACPAVRFIFNDFDGQEIEATTRIQEREWKRGTAYFRWLSLFLKPRVRRSLDIDFSKEVGPEKGSWKGGTMGHGIEMFSGEFHEAAFARYCAKHNLTNARVIGVTQ